MFRRLPITVLLLFPTGLAACGGGESPVRTPAPTVTATVTRTPSPTLASPSAITPTKATPTSTPTDPLQDVKIDPNSAYTSDQQRYLFALRKGLNKEIVDAVEIPLVATGVAACEAWDTSPNDSSTLDISLKVTDEYLSGSAIPSEYVAVAAASALCPQHKDFVLQTLGGSS